jgi:hypothetical protein
MSVWFSRTSFRFIVLFICRWMFGFFCENPSIVGTAKNALRPSVMLTRTVASARRGSSYRPLVIA